MKQWQTEMVHEQNQEEMISADKTTLINSSDNNLKEQEEMITQEFPSFRHRGFMVSETIAVRL